MSSPFVSVILPVYNGAATLDACIISLLDQIYPQDRYEILVIDNNSTDKTPVIIKKYPVQRLAERNIQGSYAARNCGIRHAKGDILAFIDADCIASRQWLSQGISMFADTKVGAVAGEIQAFPPQNEIQEYLARRNMLSQQNTMSHPFLPYPQTANAFYRRDVITQVGLFETWPSGGDADLAWRMQMRTPYQVVFDREAIVQHQHRSTICEVYRLFKKYGQGAYLLHRKYHKQHFKNEIDNNIIKTLWYLCKYLIPHALISLIPWVQDAPTRCKAKCDLVAFLGWRIGNWMGV